MNRSELSSRVNGSSTATRLAVIKYLCLAAFLVLGLRLWFLQVVDHQAYVKQAESNRLKTIPIPAARGLIVDREGRVLVDNRPTLGLVLSREDVGSQGKTPVGVVDELIARGVNLDKAFVGARIQAMRRQPLYFPVVIKADADPSDVAWVRAHQLEYPELDVVEQPQRRYPYRTMLAHVVGYVQEISQEQLARAEYQDDYRPGDMVGQSGIERVYDRLLRGKDGFRRVLVDSSSRETAQLERVDPTPGRDIRLTIDLDLQRVAEEQLGSRRGVVVALDPRNGEILALVSHSSFDPNLFSQRITTPEGKAEFQALKSDPDQPLFNRAVQGTYPTGSTWKVLLATAALEERVITMEDSRLFCGGGIQVGRRFVRCMSVHGMPDVHRALVVSCDGYFYRLGLALGVDRIESWVRRMGMGQLTGIDLPQEEAGIIPSRELKAKYNPRSPKWSDHDTVLASVGQGSVNVTPLQLLRAVAGIAMGGEFHTPHLFKDAGPPNESIAYDADEPVRISLRTQTREIVSYGMWGAVNESGTGTAARIPGFDVSGKTGTAQVVATHKATGSLKDHAWFVAFAPRAKPEIAVVVLVENVGFGGTHSAPIARAVLEAYWKKHYAPPAPSGPDVAQDQGSGSASLGESGLLVGLSRGDDGPGSSPLSSTEGNPGEGKEDAILSPLERQLSDAFVPVQPASRSEEQRRPRRVEPNESPQKEPESRPDRPPHSKPNQGTP